MQSSSLLIVPATGSQNSEQKSTFIILPNYIPITNFTSLVKPTSKPIVKKERHIKPNLKPKIENETKIDVIIPKPVKRRKSHLSQSRPKKQKLQVDKIKEEKIENEPKIEDTIIKKSPSFDCLNKFNNLNQTEYSQKLFDSIDYLSTSWNSIYSIGNDTDQKILDLFRQFHCADCLKSFQEQQRPNRVQMNTPPPPLQPISQDTINGLYNYFGPNTNQMPNLRILPLNTQETHFDTNFKTPNYPDMLNLDLQEKKLSLSRKLAQRRPKQELVERGIIPSSRLPLQHYDQLKHLEKAQLQDILENKLENRPNRETLVQKNILPDSRAAPLLQLKCNELKRARLADDLNEKLAKRPGPLELVESGILVSPDTSLTEAIKGGKIVYPKTSVLLDRHHPYSRPDYFNESNLNFNFNNLTDNDDSNASQTSNSTTKTNNTITSMSSSSVASFNFINSQNIQINNDVYDNNNSPSSYKNVSSPFNSESADSPSKMSNKSNSSRKIKSSSSVLSSSSSSSKSNKKTLIFHQYLGPNQKSSKTTLKTKPSKINKSKSSSSSLISEMTSTNNEISSDNNSNDSANYNEPEEMNAYRIRLEQQKMFLSFNHSPKQPEEVEVETKKQDTQNFNPQPIQLVPIGDVKMLDNLQNLINNGLVPIRTISLCDSNNSNQIYQIDSNLQPVQIVQKQEIENVQPETNESVGPLVNLEDLSVNKLREECSKRKLSKSGVKQKLIERLKEYAKSEVSKQVNKSFDCVESPCGFNSCEPSPVSNKKEVTKTSSLDEFFDFLNVETMGYEKKTDETSKDENDLSETLKQSLKNSAELLKQLSSADQLDDLHKLESQVKQSMQLIEKLKLASNKQNQTCVQHQQKNEIKENNIHKLRVVNSMPSNLRDLGLSSNGINQHVVYDQKNDSFNKTMNNPQIIRANKIDIPLINPIIINSNNISDQNLVKLKTDQHVTIFNQNQFQINNSNSKPQIFTTDSLQDQTPKQNINLYSNNSATSSESSSATSTHSSCNQNSNIEMDWNEVGIFELCSELNDHENLMSSNQINSNFNDNFINNMNNQQQSNFMNQSRQSDPLINANDSNMISWDFLEQDFNHLMNGYLKS